jgi:hypothetical protein
MLWGGGEEIASIVADVNRWSPHANAERPEGTSKNGDFRRIMRI